MEEQLSTKYDIDAYLGHLENLSSRIANNISLGQYNDITKLDIERKFIINKISKEVIISEKIRNPEALIIIKPK